MVTIWKRRQQGETQTSFGYFALVIFLIIGWILTPTHVLGGGYQSYDCTDCNTIAEYNEVGKKLNEVIPAGSIVYWQGEGSPAVLVYLNDIQIFPAQLNGKFSLFKGEADALAKFGFWSRELAEKWLSEADYVLVGSLYFPDGEEDEIDSTIPAPDEWGIQYLDSDERFEKLEEILLPIPGYEDEYILVYRRIR